jgi:mersacidin/lichenicidin family type 2 lantibiotic
VKNTNPTDLVRLWKDPDYRDGLEPHELPEHPAGAVELTETDLSSVLGALTPRADSAGLACTGNFDCNISKAAGGSCQLNTRGCCC